jgi:hypothetical protein
MATVRPLQSREEQSFIDRLVSDPASPPALEVVRGYVGSAVDPEHTRIYLDLRLAEYVDVPDAEIRLIHKLPESVSALGESVVWFDRSARIVHGAVGEEPRTARFLEGRLSAARSPLRAEGPGPGKPTQDTSPACCMPKPKPDIVRPGVETQDTSNACCGNPAKHTQDTSPACCVPPKPDIAPGKPTADTSPACCTPKPRAAY